MDKASKATQRRAAELLSSIGYCAVCYHQFKLEDLITLRPLADTGARSTIALTDRRVTMCKTHADIAVANKTHARV